MNFLNVHGQIIGHKTFCFSTTEDSTHLAFAEDCVFLFYFMYFPLFTVI